MEIKLYLVKYIEHADVASIKRIMEENDLILDGTKIVPRGEAASQNLNKKAIFWDQRQLAR